MLAAMATLSNTAIGQTPYSPAELTAEDYQRGENALSVHTAPLIYGGEVTPNWIDDHRFWYRNRFEKGYEFVLVNAQTGKKERAFDHELVASVLPQYTNRKYEAFELPFSHFEYVNDGQAITFDLQSRQFTCDLKTGRVTVGEAPPAPDRNAFVSPDGTKAAFIRDHNLWLRDLATGKETQLTTDGVEDFGYATNNAGWLKNDRPVLLWSPDSKKIATFQHDGRGVGEMYLATTNVGHPKLEAWKYPLPGDSLIFRIHRVVIHLDGPRVVRLQMPPDPHRSSITDHIALRDGTFADVAWSPDGKQLAFLSNSRDHKEAVFRVADPETGAVRTVLEEREETFFESGYRTSNWRFLPARNEIIWFSQRSNWGHLYRYDLRTGKWKNAITSGEWNVHEILRIDEEQGVIYFTGVGREPGDPYFQYFYRVNMDGSGLQLLTPENANHDIDLSPTGAYFVDRYSTPDTPPVSVLRNQAGKQLMILEKADISRLIETGWRPPEPFSVKARDGETDLYGLLFKPSNFDPDKKYPIINYIYPGPQAGSVGSRAFSASRRDNQAIANLGFIVVAIDAMGTPLRSKSFHAAYYGNMGDNGLPDQIAGMQQLAERHPWIDLDRAGIYGHSGGGFASTDAILRYPDFFKVAVSGAGNHDNRNYEDDWGEKWQGLLETYPDGSTNYDNQANQLLVDNLKGKLLLTHGTMDTNVPVYNTLLVADKLIEANKDFDMILFPNRGHGFANEAYMLRKRWDYFVQYLLGAQPPREYKFNLERARP
jgi:dipeptidyl aminopeptidase/acylaminoacyl peptidase